MWFLYLDESGDLGFDFVNKKPSKFFTITIIAVKGAVANRLLINSVKNTLKRKLPAGKNAVELKGSKTSIGIKKYFYEQCKNIDFGIYSLTLNKKRLYGGLLQNAVFCHSERSEESIQRRDSSSFGLRMTQNYAFRNSPIWASCKR